MQKRAFERIPAGLRTRFFYGNTIFTGTVTNLSENGMFINTRMYLSSDSRFEILIPLKEETLRVPVKVSRIVKTDDFYDYNIYKNGMGVKLLNPPQNYLEFINRLRSTL